MNTTTLISEERLEKHSVNQYTFKSFGGASNEPETQNITSSLMNSNAEPVNENIPTEVYVEEENSNKDETNIDSSAMSKNSKDALIESLMKKTDEMSSNFIKLQMKLEDKETEYAAQVEQVKTSSYNEGLEAGTKQTLEDTSADIKAGMEQFANSVTTLDSSAKEFEKALELIKSDLMSAAIDIAKEVIDMEIDTKSSEIAKVLSDALLTDLQSASNITLKVNPKDHGTLSEHVGSLEHIQVVSDSAVNEGGVIAISDAGNIDSQISKRFERVKRAALSE